MKSNKKMSIYKNERGLTALQTITILFVIFFPVIVGSPVIVEILTEYKINQVIDTLISDIQFIRDKAQKEAKAFGIQFDSPEKGYYTIFEDLPSSADAGQDQYDGILGDVDPKIMTRKIKGGLIEIGYPKIRGIKGVNFPNKAMFYLPGGVSGIFGSPLDDSIMLVPIRDLSIPRLDRLRKVQVNGKQGEVKLKKITGYNQNEDFIFKTKE